MHCVMYCMHCRMYCTHCGMCCIRCGMYCMHVYLLGRRTGGKWALTGRDGGAANLLRRSAVSDARTRKRTLAGRRWMRAYVNGCAHKVFSAPINSSLSGVPFVEAAEWMHRTSGCVLIGAWAPSCAIA